MILIEEWTEPQALLLPSVDNQLEFIGTKVKDLQYVLSGDNDALDAYAIESEIISLNEEAEKLMEMMNKSGADPEKFMTEIKNTFDKISILREKLEVAKQSVSNNDAVINEINEIMSMFGEQTSSFEEYDDVVIRRIVECVRVMKDRKIVVVLKGGLTAETQF